MSKNCDCAGITKLKELTEKLPIFPIQINPANFRGERGEKGERGERGLEGAEGHSGKDAKTLQIIDNGSSGYMEYKMEEGECFAWFVHRSGNSVAVHRWFCSKGTKFPLHVHPEKEFIVIYQGTMNLTKNGETVAYTVGDYIYNEPNIPHSAFFPEDCKFITVTIPPSKEFPNGSR